MKKYDPRRRLSDAVMFVGGSRGDETGIILPR
jgi:hypothetical protein